MNFMLGGKIVTLPETLRGPFEDFSQKANSAEGPKWEAAFKRFLRKEQSWPITSAWVANSIAESILRFVGTVTLPARAEKFVPKKSFVINAKLRSHVKIGYVDPDFIKWFGNKIEEPTTETTLSQYTLTGPSIFPIAREEIRDGGVATKTTPGDLYSMLEKQPDESKIDAGPLRMNGSAHLFEMDDVNLVARLVNAFWDGGDGNWRVCAGGAASLDRWYEGDQVFSRDSR